MLELHMCLQVYLNIIYHDWIDYYTFVALAY